jgi:hypothetical protein
MFPIVPHFFSTLKGFKGKNFFGGVANVSKKICDRQIKTTLSKQNKTLGATPN